MQEIFSGQIFKDRRFQLAAGAAAALLAGLAIAMALHSRGKLSDAPPPASRAGLVVETGRDDDTKLSPARPLRCFVAGQFAGELTLAECAKRNGVSTDALDVGRDETGALAAADVAGTVLTPLPPSEAPAAPVDSTPAQTPPADAVPKPAAAPVAACWRYEVAQWRKISNEAALGACVSSLFNGHCEKPGAASYGRWGEQTVRLVPGRVEISSDNRSFRTLVVQTDGCMTSPVG